MVRRRSAMIFAGIDRRRLYSSSGRNDIRAGREYHLMSAPINLMFGGRQPGSNPIRRD